MVTNEASSLELLTQPQKQYLERVLFGFAKPRDERSKRRERIQFYVLTVLALCIGLPIFCFELIYSVPEFLTYVQEKAWWRLFTMILTGVTILFGSELAIEKIKRYFVLSKRGLALRAILDDEEKVPIACEQPTMLKDDEWLRDFKQFGPFKPWKFSVTSCIILSICSLVFGVLMIAILVFGGQNGKITTFDDIMIEFLVAVPFTLLFCAGTCLLPFLAWNIYRSSIVKINDEGLHWWNGRYAHAAWHEIQGFYQVCDQNGRTDAHKFYVLDGVDVSLCWPVDEYSTPGDVAASNYLARLIVTRTQLPLRDLSIAVAPLIPKHDWYSMRSLPSKKG